MKILRLHYAIINLNIQDHQNKTAIHIMYFNIIIDIVRKECRDVDTDERENGNVGKT